MKYLSALLLSSTIMTTANAAEAEDQALYSGLGGAYEMAARDDVDTTACTNGHSERITPTTPLFYVLTQNLGKGAREEMRKGAINYKRKDSGTTIHPDEIEPTKRLAFALDSQQSFEQLDGETQKCIRDMKGLLVRNKLKGETPEDYAFLASWLAHAEQLEELDLSFNFNLPGALGDIAETIEMAVKEDPALKPLKNLRAIYLNGALLAPRTNENEAGVASDVGDGLAHFLSLCPNIEAVHLAQTKLGVGGAKQLNGWLLNATQLEHIDLRDCALGDEGVKSLETGLSKQKGLQYLNVINNNISADGAETLAQALPQFLDLKYLYLGDNDMGDKGVQQIVSGLEDLVTNIIKKHQQGEAGKELQAGDYARCLLDKIDLSGNGIGKEGFKSLFTWMTRFGMRRDVSLQLRRLNIEGNTAGFDEATYYRENRDGTQKKYKAYTLFSAFKITTESGEVREMLPQPFTYLRELGVSFSPNVRKDSVSKIFKYLENMEKLEKLNLQAVPQRFMDDLEAFQKRLADSKNFTLRVSYTVE